MYRAEVHYDFIARAVAAMPCPVIANGNVYSPASAAAVLAQTGARGLMIGRGAIRNPWLFDQIRQHRRGEPVRLPTGREVLAYIEAIYDAVCAPDIREPSQVQKMKKYMNYIGSGIEPTGRFLHDIRRVTTRADFFRVCAEYLDHDRAMPLEPFGPAVAAERAALTADELQCGRGAVEVVETLKRGFVPISLDLELDGRRPTQLLLL